MVEAVCGLQREYSIHNMYFFLYDLFEKQALSDTDAKK